MYELYVNYFKWLCERHPSLLHTDAQKVFELISVEQAYSDFRGKVSSTGFCFRLVDYSWGVGRTGGFEFQRKQGAFIVGKKIDPRGDKVTNKIIARNQCETICVDFITHMVADSQNGHPLFTNNSDDVADLKINVQPLFSTGDGSYDGYIVSFEFAPAREFILSCHPLDDWQQLSPHHYGGEWDLAYEGFTNWILNDGGDWQLNEDV